MYLHKQVWASGRVFIVLLCQIAELLQHVRSDPPRASEDLYQNDEL